MEGCIFCMIVRGEIPSKRVYEDELVVAFDDITPQAPVHTLVVPRKHYADMNDDIPEDLMGHLMSVAAYVAESKGVVRGGYRVLVNNGPDAGQTVSHVHLHVLGGRRLGDSLAGDASA